MNPEVLTPIDKVIAGLEILKGYEPEQDRVIPYDSRSLSVWVEKPVSDQDAYNLEFEYDWFIERATEEGHQCWRIWVR